MSSLNNNNKEIQNNNKPESLLMEFTHQNLNKDMMDLSTTGK